MNKKQEDILIIGNGKNQLKFIKDLKNCGFFTIVIDIRKRKNNYIDKFIRHSIYNKNIFKIKKELEKLNIKNIIYRSSGPAILLANNLERFYKIDRINIELAKSIYSKIYFQNFLKKNNFSSFNQKKILKLKKLNFKNLKIIKPDSPIKGKQNIFIKKKFSISDLKNCKKNSHNNKIIINDVVAGNDINSFFIVNNKKKIYKLIANFEEINFIKANTVISNGIVYPSINIQKKILKNVNIICLNIIKKFKSYKGAISITCKITPDKKIIPYEINIGLSGDGFADKIFPKIYKYKSLYELELDVILNDEYHIKKISKISCSTINSTIFNRIKKKYYL
jgi:predicted transcriptional regulator